VTLKIPSLDLFFTVIMVTPYILKLAVFIEVVLYSIHVPFPLTATVIVFAIHSQVFNTVLGATISGHFER
jgi:hypothetical protein